MGMKLIGGDFGKKLEYIVKKYPVSSEKFLLEKGARLLKATKMRTQIVTGHLRRTWKIRKVSGIVTKVVVFNNTEYAPHYEFGTDRFTGRYALTKSLNELEADMPALVDEFLRNMTGSLKI